MDTRHKKIKASDFFFAPINRKSENQRPGDMDLSTTISYFSNIFKTNEHIELTFTWFTSASVYQVQNHFATEMKFIESHMR